MTSANASISRWKAPTRSWGTRLRRNTGSTRSFRTPIGFASRRHSHGVADSPALVQAADAISGCASRRQERIRGRATSSGSRNSRRLRSHSRGSQRPMRYRRAVKSALSWSRRSGRTHGRPARPDISAKIQAEMEYPGQIKVTVIREIPLGSPMPNRPFPLVGVTGGIGSGKSAVCRCFKRLGRVVLSADSIAPISRKQIPQCGIAIAREFGQEMYGPDGGLRRSELARNRVRPSCEAPGSESIVHPVVFSALNDALAPFRRTPAGRTRSLKPRSYSNRAWTGTSSHRCRGGAGGCPRRARGAQRQSSPATLSRECAHRSPPANLQSVGDFVIGQQRRRRGSRGADKIHRYGPGSHVHRGKKKRVRDLIEAATFFIFALTGARQGQGASPFLRCTVHITIKEVTWEGALLLVAWHSRWFQARYSLEHIRADWRENWRSAGVPSRRRLRAESRA